MRECINRHAPLRRVKVTRPPAPWLKSDEIRKLQSERDVSRVRARKYNTEETWTASKTIRNKIKSVISKAKKSFLVNALSSKRSKKVWKIIHRVLELHPNSKSLRAVSGFRKCHSTTTVLLRIRDDIFYSVKEKK